MFTHNCVLQKSLENRNKLTNCLFIVGIVRWLVYILTRQGHFRSPPHPTPGSAPGPHRPFDETSLKCGSESRYLISSSFLCSSVCSVRLWLAVSGRSGPDGVGSGSQRWQPGVRRHPAPVRMPKRAGPLHRHDGRLRSIRHIQLPCCHGAEPDGCHDAQDLTQEQWHQLELQHV